MNPGLRIGVLAFIHAPRPDAAMANPLIAPLLRWLGRLSYPRLFVLTAALFVADLIVPDMIPLADELLLGLGALLLANWKNRRAAGAPRDPIEGESNRR